MPELSNMLRQRLGATQNGGGTHPDADQLTALAEQQLSGAEREQVLLHLAVCPECRDIVALSLPQTPELVTPPASQPAPVSRWRKIFSPAFGVAGLVTVMAVIAVVVLQAPKEPTDQNQARQEAKANAPSQPAVTETAPAGAAPVASPTKPDHAPASATDAIANEKRSNVNASAAALGVRSFAPSKKEADSAVARDNQPVLTASAARQDFVNTGIFDVNAVDSIVDNNSINKDGLPSAPQPQKPAAAARFQVNTTPGQINTFRDIPANQSTGNRNLAVMTPPPPPEHFGCALCTKIGTTAKKAVHSLSPGSAPALSSGALTFSAMATHSGDLQSQHPVEAKASPENSGAEALPAFDSLRSRAGVGGATAAYDFEPPIWKVAGGKLVKMTGGPGVEAFPGASFQFTFVSARGSEVWAGGTSASVIHSRDNGATWEAAKLGDTASGSIVSIFFSGNNIQVKTSDDQLWSSSDAGKTWTMQ